MSDRSAYARAMPLSCWPEADRDAWERATSAGSLLVDRGLGAHWRPETRKRYAKAYGRWLSWLDLTHPDALELMPGTRFTPERIEAFIAQMRDRDLAPSSQASSLQALHNGVRAMAPELDWLWLARYVNLLQRLCSPRPPVPARLHPIDCVYRKALRSMDQAERMAPRRPLQDSLWYRDGLMVAVAAATALRRRNLAELRVGRHLARQSDGWVLAIPGDEVKTHRPIESELPASLTSYLDRYLTHHRPRLLQGADSDRLWINQYGAPLSIHAISERLLEVTTRLGCPMKAHDFRRSFATTIAETRPDLVAAIAGVLGHSTQRTSEVHYNKARMTVSSRRFNEVIDDLRSRLHDDQAPWT